MSAHLDYFEVTVRLDPEEMEILEELKRISMSDSTDETFKQVLKLTWFLSNTLDLFVLRSGKTLTRRHAPDEATANRMEYYRKMKTEESNRHDQALADIEEYRRVIQIECPHLMESSNGVDTCSICGKTL